MDLTAKLRTVTVPPKTFEDLARKIHNDIVERNKSVYLAERNHRAAGKASEKLIIKSAKVRIPSKFQNFLNNGENKERTFELIKEFLIENASMRKCAVYASFVNRRGANDIITIRSHSGDIDIPVIMLGNNIKEIPNLFLDNGTSKDRKIYSISECTLTDEQNEAVIGIHCTTGIDQNSSILRKGKGNVGKLRSDI